MMRFNLRLPIACVILMIAMAGPLPAERLVAANNDLIQFTEQSFIQNVFGNHRSYAAARKHAENELSLQIEFVDNAVTLTDPNARNCTLPVSVISTVFVRTTNGSNAG